MPDSSALYIEIDTSKERLAGYPPIQRMPYNLKNNTVESVLDGFLLHSQEPYIVTGYTSLRRLIQFFSQIPDNADVRLLMGNEPSLSSSNVYKPVHMSYPREVEGYWLSKGLSLRQSLELVKTLQVFKDGRVEARYLELKGRMLHAKIYIGGDRAAIGSSNFSHNGLKRNIEGNVCFKKSEAKDEARYVEVCQFAERLWEDERAVDYTDKLYDLLEKLLRTVTWQESLARACSEMLEGRWANQYIASTLPIEETTIWPAQRQGVAQALCVLDQVGSVLLADATGSGKTRLGSVLLRAIYDRVWRKGQARHSAYTALICPPGVQQHWQDETLRQGLQIQPFSQGALSNVKDPMANALLERSLKQAQVLCVDEAHNFLNEDSKRTKFLVRNMADHVVLQTATPINKGQSDLLSLINILGADNFDPDSIRAFNRYLRSKNADFALKQEHLIKLKKEISRFTVSRTKADFNRLINDSPGDYVDQYGRECRYPRHDAHSYSTGESSQAIDIAHKIRALADKLKGVAYIKKEIRIPDNLDEKFTSQDIVNWRLSMAKAASVYHILSHLRSSKAAVLTHIQGSVDGSSTSKGIKYQLEQRAGKAPKCVFEIDEIEVPDWVIDDTGHQQAAFEDHNTYSKICDLLYEMDFSREETKANMLVDLVQKSGHDIVIAFDRHPVTLNELETRIKAICPDIDVLVGTGSRGDKTQFEKRLKPKEGSEQERSMIVLCSDAMSEGLNFQRASSVVNLDMPSVVRLLEQRVGRIDRMNSLHKNIDVFWPKDSQAFALNSDEKLIDRHGTVEKLIGSNVPLPEAFKHNSAESENYQEIVEEHAEHADDWDGLKDAFAPIRGLIAKDGLISVEQYQQIAKHDCDVQIQLTVVDDPNPWVFFCIGGSEFSAPKWVFIEDGKDGFETDFDVVSQALIERLKGQPGKSEPIDELTQTVLDEHLDHIVSLERQLIPKRKQVALKEMEQVLNSYRQDDLLERENREFLDQLVNDLFGVGHRPKSMDWGSVADRWLELIRPYWYQELDSEKRKRAILLKDIRDRLLNNPIPIERIMDAFSEIPFAKPIENRIVACIITKASME